MLELYHEIRDYFDLTKEEPRNVALGAALAAFLGFVPLKCGLVALIVFLIGMTDASGTVAAILGLLLKPVSMYVFDPTAIDIGRKICESDFAKSHAGLFNAPGLALLGLEKYHVMGGATLGLMAAIPFFIVFYRLQMVVLKIREKAVVKATALKKKRAEEKAAARGKSPEEIIAAGEAAIAPKPEKKPGLLGKILAIRARWQAIPLKKWIFLAIVLTVFELFFAKPMMRTILKEKMPDGLAKALGMVDPVTGQVTQRGKVDFDDASFDFSLVRGRLHMEKLEVTNPKNTKEDLFKANVVEAKISFLSLLRKQFVVELLQLDTPKLAVARESDGTLSIEPPATAGTPPAAQGSSDWATKAKSYMDRAKKEYEERKKKKEDEKKAAQEGKKTDQQVAQEKKPSSLSDAIDRAEDGLPGENDDLLASKWVVKEVKLSGFSVDLQDPQTQAPGFAFNDGKVLEMAQNRLENGQATVLDLVGALVDVAKKEEGKLKLNFSEDPPTLDGKPVGFKLHAEITDVSLHDTDGLFANVVPFSFDKGTATITVDATGHGLDGDLDATPKIAFKDVVAKARNPNEQVAGFPASKVAEEITNCGAFDLNDIHITGCVLAPKVELGDTIKNLVVQGGTNFAKKKGQELLNKEGQNLLDKANKKVPGIGDKADDLKKKLGGELPSVPNPFGK